VSDVKASRRGYRSALRGRQAPATREPVLDAARELFRQQGYGVTTIEQIAERAGVSKPTVFAGVGNKQAVMTTLRTLALRGDEEPETVAEREPWRRILAEPDPYKAIELEAEHLADLWSRWAELKEALRGAASSGEPALRELWATGRPATNRRGRRFVVALAAKGPLHDKLDRTTATDIAPTRTSSSGSVTKGRGSTEGGLRRWRKQASATSWSSMRRSPSSSSYASLAKEDCSTSRFSTGTIASRACSSTSSTRAAS
jgi:TetR/AcrR family transcriptional regulator, regulator of autoinduction and epiphytic fitness